MKKIVTVVGARPQFIKAAMVSPLLRQYQKEILVHTGQHYDYNMSEKFFEELSIPKPDYNLGISGGSHAQMTGKMMVAIEEVLISEKPDALLVYGDTNSTLAAALAAAKLGVPVHHVEGGTRTHSLTNPEEINRVCTDHISSFLYASTALSMEEIKRENLFNRAVFSGDLMYDSYLKYSNHLLPNDLILKTVNGNNICINSEYYYLTCHRQENTDETIITEILYAMNSLDGKTVYPVHPRNAALVRGIVEKKELNSIILTEPLGYLESLALINGARAVVTDSGGLQREAFFAQKKCVTILDFEVWPETMVGGCNVLSKPDKNEILMRLKEPADFCSDYKPFGNGDAHKIIVNHINNWN